MKSVKVGEQTIVYLIRVFNQSIITDRIHTPWIWIDIVNSQLPPYKVASSPKAIISTAPSSYWYLQHFDLPGLLQHADWVNVM